MRFFRPICLILMISAIAGAAAGCNTVKGAGKDLQRGGEAIENAADRARR